MQTPEVGMANRIGRVIVTDQERRDNYYLWAAFQEGNWEYFGVPRRARVHLRRLEDQQATAIEWER
jgi:hypothetical protein